MTRPAVQVQPEDKIRADAYGLLARLLCDAPDQDLLSLTAEIEGDGTPLGSALSALAEAATTATAEALSEEYLNLFIGVAGGELKPYCSFYLTGFSYEKPLAKLRVDMDKLGIARRDGVKEPEDHMASLCEIMAGLITGAFGAPADLETQQWFFDRHLAPWARFFFEDLESADSARFYKPVGTVGRLFMKIETTAFEMAA
ncbi:MAG: molecular chaperone TorD family protein [Proteobacteria bacterium]|nr:molecular chaperone TorD family protein [Pseudomonadota bacterium]